MEKLQIYRNTSLEWKPTAVVALATSPDGAQVAAARGDGSLEIWLVSPGSVGWHCQLTIRGNPGSRMTSLVWCSPNKKNGGLGPLLSSSVDGSVSEWDLFSLKQKLVLDSVGVSIWQMALEPSTELLHPIKQTSQHLINGYGNEDLHSDLESCQSDSDTDDSYEIHSLSNEKENQRVAIACDDGCIRLYVTSDSDGLIYKRSFPRVSGRVLSVAWSFDAKLVFSGSSDGLIRCWDAMLGHETYRITVGLGGLGNGSELCVWSLLFLRCGTLVSADSTGSVQFWDSSHGTLLQAYTYHKGDANALAAAPSHNRVFSAGSDGQVILYKLSKDSTSRNVDLYSKAVSTWAYVGYVRAHTHDVRALAVAVPICTEEYCLDEKSSRLRSKKKPIDFSYRKWAHIGVPMLLSAGDDTKIYAYSATEFTRFSPHDICPAPQRVPVQLASSILVDGAPIILAQSPGCLDILSVQSEGSTSFDLRSGRTANTPLLARIKSKKSRKIISSTISNRGMFAYSDCVKPSLFELRKDKIHKNRFTVFKRKLPKGIPSAHCMIFSADSSLIMLAGHDRKIYVVDVERSEFLHIFVPCRKEINTNSPPSEPPITKMFVSLDGQWLAAINCFGDIYIFNLEIYRQHWFISRLDGASVTAGGFPPGNCNVLVITTSSNLVYVFDVEAKELGEWSKRNTFMLPRRFQEFPGEVIGLSFPPSSSTSVIVYSARAMCFIDFGMVVDHANADPPNDSDISLEKLLVASRNATMKRKRKDSHNDSLVNRIKNFDFCPFKDPVLFVSHLSEKSLVIFQKPWLEIVRTFDAPVHRHLYGS